MISVFTYLVGHAYEWGTKLIFVLIMVALWSLWVEPYLIELKVFIQWWLNQTVYPLVSFEAANFACFVFVMLSTYKVILWVFGGNAHKTEEGNFNNNSARPSKL